VTATAKNVTRIASVPGLDPTMLKERYQTELRFQLGNQEREDLTLTLWWTSLRT
jgi:hypothetical protein